MGEGAMVVSEDTQAIIDQLASGAFEVPLLPQVASQVMAICSNPDCEIKELIDTIKNDQALMAHVMRMANSALYAADVDIVSIQLAVNRLGLQTVRDLAVAAACKGAVFKGGVLKVLVNRMFKRAMSRGLFAQEIARIRRRNVEMAFLSGMMSEIGAPVVAHALSKANLEQDHLLSIIEEHTQSVTVTVLESWALPGKLIDVIRNMHDPDSSEAHFELIHTIRMADHFAGRVVEDVPKDGGAFFEDACIALNLFGGDIERLDAKGEEIKSMVEALG